ncbi:hypothetical protein Tco_1461509 [Tanacetum coccineum]
MIDKMNKKAAGMDEEEVPEESESTKVEVKQEQHEENIRKRSSRRLKMKATKKSKRQKTDSDLEEEEQLRASLKIVPDEEEETDYEVLGTKYPIVNWESTFYHTDRYGVTPPKCDTQRNTTIRALLHNTCTRVLVKVQRYVYKTNFLSFIRKIRVT